MVSHGHRDRIFFAFICLATTFRPDNFDEKLCTVYPTNQLNAMWGDAQTLCAKGKPQEARGEQGEEGKWYFVRRASKLRAVIFL